MLHALPQLKLKKPFSEWLRRAPAQVGWAEGQDPANLVCQTLSHINQPKGPTLGVVYVHAAISGRFERILDYLKLALPSVDWIGSVSPSMYVTGHVFTGAPGIAILLLPLEQDDFRILPSVRSSLAGKMAGLAPWMEQNPNSSAFVHGDCANLSIDRLLSELDRRLPRGRVNGGLVGYERDSLQVADQLASGGLSGVLLGHGVKLVSAHATGVTAIAGVRSVTRAERNLVLEIDHRPALDVLREDVGELLWRKQSAMLDYIYLNSLGDNDPSELHACRMLKLSGDLGGILLDRTISENVQVCFGRRNSEAALSNTQRMGRELQQLSEGRRIRAGFFVTNALRARYHLHTLHNEVDVLHRMLGTFPLIGFQSRAEVHDGQRYGHASTLTLVLD